VHARTFLVSNSYGESRDPLTCECSPIECPQDMCPDGESRDPLTCECHDDDDDNKEEEKEDDDDDDDTGLIVGLSVGGAALLGLFAFFILKGFGGAATSGSAAPAEV